MFHSNKQRIAHLFPFLVWGAVVLFFASVVLISLAIRFDWDADVAQWVIALGTWVGGLFTGGALLFTAVQLDQEIRRQNIVETRRQQALLNIAQQCAFRLRAGTPISVSGGKTEYKTLEVSFTNKTRSVIRNISVIYMDEILASAKQVSVDANPWGYHIPIRKLNEHNPSNLESLPESDIKALVSDLSKVFLYSFQIEDLVFTRIDDDVTLERTTID